MSTNALDELLGVSLVVNNDKAPSPSLSSDSNEEAIDDFTVYGSDRTRRQKNMVSFIKAEGTTRHVPYGQIMMVEESKGLVMTVFAHSGTITLEGKRLDLIGQRIKHGDLSYVRESNKSNPVTTDDGVCVTSIRFA